MDVLRVTGRDEEMLEAFSQKLGGYIGGNHVRKYTVANNGCHYLCLSRDLLQLACFYKDVKDAEGAYHIYLPERYTEWGSFLKLPVTVHPIPEVLP